MFQLILSPIRDWNADDDDFLSEVYRFQLILSPIRDWNIEPNYKENNQQKRGSN